MRITPVPWDLEPDADYLLGGPGESTCEVVRTSPSGTTGPGRTRHVLRGRYGTLASPHPAGTPVTPVTAERVEDWSRWSGSPEGEPGPGRARDTGSSPGS